MTATVLTSGSTTSLGTSIVTASVSPSSNTLLILDVGVGSSQSTPTVTGNGLTWVLMSSDLGSRSRFRYRAMGASPSAGTITIASPDATTYNQILYILTEITDVDITGTDGSGAIVQNDFSGGNGSTPTESLTSSVTSGNYTLSAIHWNENESISVDASWTLLATVNENGPVSSIAVAYADPGTDSVTYTKASTVAYRHAIAELKAAAGPGGSQSITTDLLVTSSTVFSPSTAGGAPPVNPVFRSLSSNTDTPSTSATVSAPTGVQAGDLQFCIIAIPSGDAPASTTDPAWEQVLSYNNPHAGGEAGENEHVEIWFSNSDTGDVTFTKGTSTHAWHILRIAYYNTEGYANFQVEPQNLTNTRETTHTIPSQTTTDNDVMIVAILTTEDADTATFTLPMGWTERYQVDANPGGGDSMTIILIDEVIPSPTTVSGEVITTDNFEWSTNISFKLLPSDGLSISVPVIHTTSSVLNPTILQTQTVTVELLATASTVFNPVILATQRVTVQLLANPALVLGPGVTSVVQVALDVLGTVTNFFNPSVTTSNSVVLPVLNVPSNVRQPMTDTTVNVESEVIVTTSTVNSPSIKSDISLPSFASPANVLNPEVPSNIREIDLPLLTTETAILNPGVTTSNTVNCQVLTVPASVKSPGLKYTIQTELLEVPVTIHAPSLEYLVSLPVLNTVPTIHAPVIGEPPEVDTATGAIVKTQGYPPFPIGI